MDSLGVPLLALAGTLVVALLGLYQWRKKRTDDLTLKTREKQREAYEGLWTRLEAINIKLREEHGNAELPRMLRELNVYFLQNSLWFQDSEQQTINEYVSSLERLRSAIFRGEDRDVINLYFTTISSSALSRELEPLEKQMTTLRVAVKQKVLSHMGAR